MYTFDAGGIWMEGDFNRSKTIPYEEVLEVSKISLAETVLTAMNPLKPGLCETYMGVTGDPLHVVMIETKDGRYLLRVDDPDKSVAEINAKLGGSGWEVKFAVWHEGTTPRGKRARERNDRQVCGQELTELTANRPA